jgi:uncharacterized phage protein gp47/JayE
MGTQEDIIQRINGRLDMDANLLEGGFSQDIIGSVAYELANIYDTELENLANKVFVATATGDDLDKVGADYGIARRESQQAIVYLVIEGVENAIINQNVKATYNNLVYTVTEYKKIDSSGVATVKAKCETSGVVGNVPANTITEFVTNYQGLTSVNNPAAAYDGFDKEDDETYRARIIEYLAEDATNANAAQYKQWALSVAGVQSAVIKSADTMGAGNVGVYISAVGTTVSDELKAAVKSYIEEVQPINANVIVNGLTYVTINVNATIVLHTGYTTDAVTTEFTELLSEYLKTVDNTVSYFKISELLYACSGVDDVTTYTLNGDTESVTLSDTDYPTVGGVVIAT